MLETKHHWLPVVLAAYLPISIIITYSIAVGNGHVAAGFPYISDTGTHSPESCVFGQLLNIGAVIAGIIVYIRYRHIVLKFRDTPTAVTILRLNTAAFILGTLTVFGVSVVGNFQETNVIVVHIIGAFLAFAVGFFYMVLQTVISFKTAGISDIPGNSLNIRRLRFIFCVVDFVLLILLFIMTGAAARKGPGEGASVQKWTDAQPGYAEHLVATISEWLVAFVTVAYFATFYTEFKHFRMKPPEVVYYKTDETLHEATGFATGTTNYNTFIQEI